MYVDKSFLQSCDRFNFFCIIQVKDDEDRRLVKLQTQIEELSNFNKDKVTLLFLNRIQ